MSDLENVEKQSPDPFWREAVSTTLRSVSFQKKTTLRSVPFWNNIFVIACVIAVSLDPLFFYIPIINEEKKCLAVDKKLRTVALILRSLTDVTFVVNIIYQVDKAIKAAQKGNKAENIPFAKLVGTVARNLEWKLTLTSILAVFPMPQFLLVFVFFNMRRNGYLHKRKILNVFLLAQYLPRIYRIYLASRKLRTTTGIWAKALFNFFLYILSSHVLGGFWYFFSIQRETSCWHRACVNNLIDHPDVERCMTSFYCEGRNTTAEITAILNKFCPISVEANATAHFDFGIFLDSLKNKITRDIHFGTKFSYSFWWGLRNLSNFGTNLQTSTYVWETCFAVLISVIGLLLFLYLIGNVQTFLSMETQRREDTRKRMELKKKVFLRWMRKHRVPKDLKEKITKNIEEALEENKDADLENLFSILHPDTKEDIKQFLCMKTLKKVPKLESMPPQVLNMMCDYLNPVTYATDTMVLNFRDPLHSMLLINEGKVLTYRNTSDSSHGGSSENAKTGSSKSSPTLSKGDFYGAEDLIKWVNEGANLDELPISDFNVKCSTRVEGFKLTAEDLKSVVSECYSDWNQGINRSVHNKC